MYIVSIGGGPAGLYASILLKRDFPQARVRVFERNAPADTFGFGVVFSDQTLDIFAQADLPSYEMIRREFSYWDDLDIAVRGQTFRVPGNGFCGCSRRTLLQLLYRRAEELGVELNFRTEVSPEEFPEADLILAADGIGSAIREKNLAHFQPAIDLRSNRFVWLGSTRALDAFTFFFREHEGGVFVAHCYQYERERSTWVIEVDEETFARCGLGDMTEAEYVAYLEGVFAEDLEGHSLIANRSIWRRFPAIRCRNWSKDNIVLMGDAKSTAHYSIGSGTKLAMEDAIALHAAVMATDNIADALAKYGIERRDEVERLQHAAEVSLTWFEHLNRYWPMSEIRFAFSLMTRSKAITWDNLALRAPDFVAQVQKDFETDCTASGCTTREGVVPAFQPFRLREMEISNRLVVSPMSTYRAHDGVPGEWHLVHYGRFAASGAGLIYTEMTDVCPDGRITPACTGLYTDRQEAAWRRIVDFVHAEGDSRICLQLGHAGRKGATRVMWEGMDQPLAEGGWDLVSASPLPYHPHSAVPRAMTRDDMDRVTADYVAATRRAVNCGFDMIEVHCAHGYLLASFLSPLTNIREDEYGGSIENRMRYPLEVVRAVRAAWPADRPMAVRISATDWQEGGISMEDVVTAAGLFAQAGCDLIDVSTGQTTPDARPVFGRMFQVPFAEQIRAETGLPVMCVGNISSVDQANTILAAGRADLVALGRPLLVDTSLILRAAARYGAPMPRLSPGNLPGLNALERNEGRNFAEEQTLRIRARPRRHAVT
ncbi:FAD-dependent monooxygenase [Komagataeibacter sp. FNDCR2]|uniref:oxidoreductase n=1 Tax=Komagataeibacter sp. FNDCR2 TaxID=2878682 RepID=UPI001E431F83|nr:FAD-dependent monooxygenase [Komagataeibacter sp. FNDCR2]MCE2574109.1 FAD-dependent monooxygenase [Komagataeibacter sp. FNDCR2]